MGLDGRTDLLGYQAFIDGATLEGSQENFHHIDPEEVEDKPQIYKLMIGGITPRPIAFCSTISPSGVKNLAPFSYFAPLGFRPPMASLSLLHTLDNSYNEIATRKFRLMCLVSTAYGPLLMRRTHSRWKGQT